MSQIGLVERFGTDPAVDFRSAIAQNAAAYLDLLLPQGISAGRTCRCRFKEITIVSQENIGWELWLYSKRTLSAESVTGGRSSNALGYWSFTSSMGTTIGGAVPYYYYIPSLDISYENLDVIAGTGVPDESGWRRYLHMALVAREAGKSAGDAGAVQITMTAEPSIGW